MNSTIGAANVQVGGDVHGPNVAGDLTVHVVTAQTGPAQPIDEGAVLAAGVARYRSRNRSVRPAIIADHPAVSVLVDRVPPLGVVSRQLFLGDTQDADRVNASYDAGVLTLRIPIAEKAKPRKITIEGRGTTRQEINA